LFTEEFDGMKRGSLTLDACLVKSGTLSDTLMQLFPNLQRLTVQERSEALRTLTNKFLSKAAQPASESLAREHQQENQPKATKNSHDGSEPLAHLGHEATAQYISNPKSEREVKNVTELAKSLGVTRKTIYVWQKDPGVLRRAQCLTAHRKSLGEVTARREWDRVIQAQVEKAVAGDTSAAKFVGECAWPKEKRLGTDAGLSSMSVKEMLIETLRGDEGEPPTGMLEAALENQCNFMKPQSGDQGIEPSR